MINVTLYIRSDCKLCEEAEADLKALQQDVPHKLTVIDIDSDPSFQSAFALDIPVVEAGPFKLKAPFTRQQLKMTLGAAIDRRAQLERINDKAFQMNTAGSQGITRSDRFSLWLSKHYLAIFNIFLLLYVGITFLAPVFKKVGWNGPAEVVYKIYSPLCHQWAFRSFFLFGEQAYYPHAAANISGADPRFFERAVHYDQLSAEAAQKLEAFSRKLAMDALLAANREAQAICASDPGGAHRWNFGLYVFTEPNENPQRQRPNSDDQE